MADPVSGELVIVPLGVADDLELIQWADDDAKEFCESYEKNGYYDYRLITKAEALAILDNETLVNQLGLPVDDNYWTIEGIDELFAWFYSYASGILEVDLKSSLYYALPVRKVNFYGLPLIESEFGGGLVFDVVAETRTVYIIPEWADIVTFETDAPNEWEASMNNWPERFNDVIWETLPTRVEALKIFRNSYLVTLAGLPLDKNYWTCEEEGNDGQDAYIYDTSLNTIGQGAVIELLYALPVRSEVVPET